MYKIEYYIKIALNMTPLVLLTLTRFFRYSETKIKSLKIILISSFIRLHIIYIHHIVFKIKHFNF